MSVLLGCWVNAEAVDTTATLEMMHQPVKVFPHDKSKLVKQDNVGFGQQLLYNTPEAIYENLPVYLQEPQLLFTAQGRIDNREQLAQTLNLDLDKGYPDGSIILDAFTKWGKACVHHLKGDWTFAVFDYKAQELFIARAPMGYTTLHYYQDHTGIYFSSSIKSLLAVPTYTKDLHELHFIRTLTLWDDTKTEHDTYFKGIYTLPTGHALSVCSNNITIKKYWQPQNTPIRHYKNKQDYAEELFEIFKTAVEVRLRSYKPTASMLSGGLDSSTVSYVAADLLKSRNTVLTTLSHVPLFAKELLEDREHVRRILDETPFINAIANASGNINAVLLNSATYGITKGITEAIDIYDAPLHGASNIYWLHDICETAVEKGMGSLLSGEGGNGTISFESLDYLLPFNVSTLVQNPYQFFKRQFIRPMLLKYFPEIIKNRRGVLHSLEKYVQSMFLRPSIIERYNILEDIKENKKDFNSYTSDISERKIFFTDVYNLRSTAGATLGNHLGFEFRDPTVDIDVVEYIFSMPNEAFFDNHYNNRMLVKRMMRGKIPDTVLLEKRKGLQNADIVHRAKAQAGELTAVIEKIGKSVIVNEYIDTQRLTQTWELYLRKEYVEPYQIQRLLKALQFALFLQTNFD